MTDEPLRSEFADDPEMAELLEYFVTELMGMSERVAAAEAAGDGPALRRLGHQLRGSGGSYGYPAITVLGGALEDAVNRAGGGVDDAVRLAVKEVQAVRRRILACR